MMEAGRLTPGFSLLEILVALAIFSFGLLGIAALQTVSLQRNYAAYLRTVAVTQLVNGRERFRVGNKIEELRLWNDWNRHLLPEAKGAQSSSRITLCWLSKSKICLHSVITT